MKEILVTIQCITFNQVHYLAQALEGFLGQQTDFGVEIIVHDDASTDGTTELLQRYAAQYPDRIIPLYEEVNQWKTCGMKPTFQRMTEMSRGKYIAYCEGDDYWQDPLKLQKQVDAMERHPEATICYTAFQPVDNEGRAYQHAGLEQKMANSESGEIFFKLLRDNFILTVTTLYRKEVFTSPIYLNTNLRLDYFAILSAAALGKAIYLPERTSCYRQTPTGAMATQLPWVQEKYFAIRRYFIQQYALGNIKKPLTWAGISTLIEALNRAIREQAAGDGASLSQLLNHRPQLRWLYPWAWCQVKWQNYRWKRGNK